VQLHLNAGIPEGGQCYRIFALDGVEDIVHAESLRPRLPSERNRRVCLAALSARKSDEPLDVRGESEIAELFRLR
jgi:hypothetical protein